MGRRMNELGQVTMIRMGKPGKAPIKRRMDREGNDNDGCIVASDNKDGQVGSGDSRAMGRSALPPKLGEPDKLRSIRDSIPNPIIISKIILR